jgi:hypothetical protein
MGAAAELTVAADGSGQFRTVQGALDAVPATNQEHVVICIKNGDYPDQVRIKKSFVTLRGEDRYKTRLCAAVDSDRIARGQDWSQVNPRNPSPSRATLEIDGASDVTIENLTITNPFRSRGYAFALFTVNGATRLSFVDCDLTSNGGDTVSPWSRGLYYFRNCRFAGTYHFFGPRGTCYVTDCEFCCLGHPASMFNEGIMDETDKLVVRNSTFDGPKPFGLGSYFRDAAWYFIDCRFSNMLRADGVIFRQPANDYTVRWGADRVYFSGCEGPDYPWLKDNISASPAKSADHVTAHWTLRGWDPESTAGSKHP